MNFSDIFTIIAPIITIPKNKIIKQAIDKYFSWTLSIIKNSISSWCCVPIHTPTRRLEIPRIWAISPFLNPVYAPHYNGANKTISSHIIL